MQVALSRHFFFLLIACLVCGAGGCGQKAPVPPDQTDYDFAAPRTAWLSLDVQTRSTLDTGLAKRPKPAMCVIHGTGSPAASASGLADNHQRVRGIGGGMAYHFVIGNGHGIADGSLVIGPRWLAGTASGAGDDISLDRGTISICLVGDFNRAPPSLKQLQTLDELLDYLTGKIGPYPVRLHREIENSRRACPGKHFPVRAMRRAYSL